MGKTKTFKIEMGTVDRAATYRMTRQQLQTLVKNAIPRDLDPELRDELQMMAATVERVAWGAWFLRPRDGDPQDVCGCAVANVCSWVSFDLYPDHPAAEVPYASSFIHRYDTAMKRLHKAAYGIAVIED